MSTRFNMIIIAAGSSLKASRNFSTLSNAFYHLRMQQSYIRTSHEGMNLQARIRVVMMRKCGMHTADAREMCVVNCPNEDDE